MDETWLNHISLYCNILWVWLKNGMPNGPAESFIRTFKPYLLGGLSHTCHTWEIFAIHAIYMPYMPPHTHTHTDYIQSASIGHLCVSCPWPQHCPNKLRLTNLAVFSDTDHLIFPSAQVSTVNGKEMVAVSGLPGPSTERAPPKRFNTWRHRALPRRPKLPRDHCGSHMLGFCQLYELSLSTGEWGNPRCHTNS